MLTDDATLDNRHRIALPYWARPGLLSFAKPAGGGGKDDDAEDDDEDDDAEDDDEDEDDDDDLADLTEDELKAELRKTRESLSKASGSSKKKRDRIRSLERELTDARTGKPAPKPKGEKDDAPDLDAVKAAAKAEAESAAADRIKKAEARGALRSRGVAADQVGDLVGMLKLADIAVDTEGEVDGDDLEEAIDALQKKYPQLFTAPKVTRRRERVAGDADRGGDGQKVPRKKLSTSELQAAAALGRRVA